MSECRGSCLPHANHVRLCCSAHTAVKCSGTQIYQLMAAHKATVIAYYGRVLAVGVNRIIRTEWTLHFLIIPRVM